MLPQVCAALQSVEEKKMSNWPYDKIFDKPSKGLRLQQHTTYRVKGDKMEVTIITRRFYGADDYQDSAETMNLDIKDDML